MSHPHEDLIRRFYEAFARRDGDTMAAAYHGRATFSDPAFPKLEGARIGAMWRMLCGRAKDLTIEFDSIKADDHLGQAHWEPKYTFQATGRRVHNIIDATFRFEDGLIIEHVDHFNFWHWSRQALGPAGLLLGWTPFLKSKVQKQAGAALESFKKKS
jgi:ketosteroid isomerase-like protein